MQCFPVQTIPPPLRRKTIIRKKPSARNNAACRSVEYHGNQALANIAADEHFVRMHTLAEDLLAVDVHAEPAGRSCVSSWANRQGPPKKPGTDSSTTSDTLHGPYGCHALPYSISTRHILLVIRLPSQQQL